MLEKERYANGQKTYELAEGRLSYFFKNGTLKAEGPYEDDQMQGEWTFYRETGQLWVIGHLKDNLKHGSWIRYNKNDEVEYQETFESGKLIKKKTQ